MKVYSESKVFEIFGDFPLDLDKKLKDFINSVNDNTISYNIPVVFKINCNSNLYSYGYNIFNIIKEIRNPVYSVIYGDCAGSATLVHLATKKENRFAMPNARFIIYTSEGYNEYNVLNPEKATSPNQNDLEKVLSSLKMINQYIIDLYTRETKIPISIVKNTLLSSQTQAEKMYIDLIEKYEIAKKVKIENFLTVDTKDLFLLV